MAFESLECRRALATLTVTSLSDAVVTGIGSAPGTLRQAVYDANQTAEPDVIQFASNLSGTIPLAFADDTASGASSLLVTSEITIRGNANGITIGRDVTALEMRLFRVTTSGKLTVESISISGGLARGTNASQANEAGVDSYGGAVLNEGTLKVLSSTLYANQAIGGNGLSAAPGAGHGGAIYNAEGTLIIGNSTFSGNAATPGLGTGNGSSFGGNVASLNGTVTLHNSTFTDSSARAARSVLVLAIEGVANVDIQSCIIGQSDSSTLNYELSLGIDATGEMHVSGANNLIRTQNDFEYIRVSTDDPQLLPLANYGGPTMTHALATTSPALNAGNNVHALSRDQRGASFDREVGTAADIGAYEVQTVVAPELPGDYNLNHIVDAADYVLWRETFGSTVPRYSGADGDGNGQVDNADYGVWRSHFGQTPPAAGAVASTVEVGVTDALRAASAKVGRSEGSTPRRQTSAGLTNSDGGASRVCDNLILSVSIPTRSSKGSFADPLADKFHSRSCTAQGEGPVVNAIDAMFATWSAGFGG